MAGPAGPLPNAGQIQDFSARQRAAGPSVAYPGGTNVDLTAGVGAGGLAPCATEFYCTTAGHIDVMLAGDAVIGGGTVRSYTLTAGAVLPGLFVYVASTSTAIGFFRQ